MLSIGCARDRSNLSEQIRKYFKDPPLSFLPTVYWFWNGKIDNDQIKWQLEEMKRSHTIGSVCILAWEGLAMEYLSDEWFEKVKYACQIAKDLGLDIWLYDEIRWPSGHAGGKVRQANPELAAKCLAQTEQRLAGGQQISIPINSEPVAIIAGQLKNNFIAESSLIDVTSFFDGHQFSWNAPEGEWSIFIYSIEQCRFQPTFLDREYVDLLNPEVAKQFIGLTHEQYFGRMPEFFGRPITAIITDEPGCYCNLKAFRLNPQTVAWTPSFFEAFRSRKNYDLKKFLPALWHDIGAKTAQLRIDFYDVLSDLLQGSYFKPLHDWCEAHHIRLNIQPAHEETMKYSTLMQGDYFKAMAYSHLPGCDDVYSWDKTRITPKLATSAAHSFGRQDVYCEVFAAYGWDVTLEKMKAVTDWLFARGVNRLLLSSFYFASEGDWRFEIPPSLFHQNTQWRYLPHYSHYVQRLSFLLSGGRNGTPIAMLYPNQSVQAALSPLDEKLADQIDSAFIRLSNFLLEQQLDFDYLNESALNQAEIKTAADKAILRLNHKEFWNDYELLILPLAKVLEPMTLKKLQNFHEQGGRIIAYGHLPQFSLPGIDLTTEVSPIWHELAGSNTNSKQGRAFWVQSDLDSLKYIIESCLTPDLRLESPNRHISFIHKIKDGYDIYFIANSDSVAVNAKISFSMPGVPQLWDAEAGTITNAAFFHYDGHRTIVPVALDGYGSVVIVFDQPSAQSPPVVKSNLAIERIEVSGDSVFVFGAVIEGGENFVVLSWQGKELEKRFFADPPQTIELADCWNFKPADNSFPAETRRSGSWTEEQTIKQLDGSAIAPAHPYFSGTGIYSQTFHLDSSLLKEKSKFNLEAGQVNAVLEVWLNGKKVGERCWRPYAFDITAFVKPGENELELRITNTPANHYALKFQRYRLGENWGKIVPSGLMDRVRLICYEKFRMGFWVK